MSSGNVVIIPVDGSKNSERAVSCKSLFEKTVDQNLRAIFVHVLKFTKLNFA